MPALSSGVTVEQRPLVTKARQRLGRLAAQPLVDGREQRRADAQVENAAERSEHERHRECERQRQPDADRKRLISRRPSRSR